MTKAQHKTRLTLCREAEEARLIKLGIQPRGTVQPGNRTQAEIDALPADYEPIYGNQLCGMVASGQRRRRNGFTRFILKLRRAIEK